jgi:hypothetical protein
MSARWRLFSLLAVSYGLRVGLASCGGQLFWPDESRYLSAQNAVLSLRHGAWREAFVHLFGHADHVLFRVFGLPVAFIEVFSGQAHPVLVACYFSLFSVATIALVWALARRLGAPDEEAMWSAFLAAASNSLFYYSRHFFPYDVSLAVMMGGLYLGLANQSMLRSFAVGCVVGLGFLVYNGYWLLGGVVLGVSTFAGGKPGVRAIASRAMGSISGLVATVAVVLGLGHLASGIAIQTYISFAGTITQGDFGIGYRVAAAYLWTAERGLLLVIALATGYGLIIAVRDKFPLRTRAWLFAVFLIFAGLTGLSDVFPKLVVYGRLVRTLVPFLCLLGGYGLAQAFEVWRPRAPRSNLVVGIVIVIFAAANFRQAYSITYPDQFRPIVRDTMSVTNRGHFAFHRVLYTGSLWGVDVTRTFPTHTELVRVPHPMEFLPYQYEGFSAGDRMKFETNDISMRVLEVGPWLDPKVRGWSNFPGPVRMVVQFDSTTIGDYQPLVASGIVGAGDVLWAHSIDEGHIVFGLSHVGADDITSQPVALDLAKRHTLVISMGSLWPGPGDTLYLRRPELSVFRDRLIVIADGRTVFSGTVAFHPSSPSMVAFGNNLLFFPRVSVNFTGTVAELSCADEAALQAKLPATAATAIATSRDPLWMGSPGLVRVKIALSQSPKGIKEPILSIGSKAAGQVLYIANDGANGARIGLDAADGRHWEGGSLRIHGVEPLTIDIAAGSLLPPESAPVYAHWAGLKEFRNRFQVRVDGDEILNADLLPVTCPPRQVVFGENPAGISGVASSANIQILSVDPIGPEKLPEFGRNLTDLVGSPSDLWEGYPGPIRLCLDLGKNESEKEQPLVSTGTPGAAEVLTVKRVGVRSVIFTFRSGNDRPIQSHVVVVTDIHRVPAIVSMGGLLPPWYSSLFRLSPEALSIKGAVEVVADGQEALYISHEPLISESAQAHFGMCVQPISGVERSFMGRVLEIGQAKLADCFRVRSLAGLRSASEWAGYPGPLHFKVVVPAPSPGAALPLVTSGSNGAGDFIFLSYGPDLEAKFGHDHWGSQPAQSSRQKLEPGSVHDVLVSFGALYPPETINPSLDRRVAHLRNRSIVAIDGKLVLDSHEPSYAATPEQIVYGENSIGGSSTRALFDGAITVTPASVEDVEAVAR